MLKRGFVGFLVGAVGGFAMATVSCSTTTSSKGGTSGSGSSSGGGPTCQADGGTTCQSVGDCPNQSNFTCEVSSNCCVFVCKSQSDCGSATLGDPGDPCTSSSLGCVCDQGQCKSKQCSADADCGNASQVCKGGNCQAPDSASSAATILVQPSPAALHVGAAQQFTATVLDKNGNAVILAPGGITWAVSGSNTGGITSAGVFTPTNASTKFGDTTITATAGSVSGTAAGTIYAAPTAPAVQLTLIDGAANIPITDATVEYSNASGAVVGTAVTSGSPLGVYTLAAPPAGAVLLNVFEQNYQYVSVDATALPSSNDFVLFLAQNTVNADAGPVVGGYTGNFQTTPGILDPNNGEPVSQTGDIHIGIAGTAVPQDLLDISLSALLGPSHDVTINIGGSHTVPLPEGIELGFGTTYFTCSYDGLGAAGGCGLPPCTGGNTTGCLNSCTDPTGSSCNWANSAFACGQRSAWGLGGNVPFSAISAQLGNLASGSVSIGAILTAVLPDFSGFESGVFFQVPYTLQSPVPANQVVDSCTGADFTDTASIPQTSQLNQNVGLQLNTPLALLETVTLPALPSNGAGSAPGNCQTTALVLGGAIEPGYGLLPLGLSAGTILNSSNNPSSNCEVLDTNGNATGNVLMNVAPEHGGVERDTYGVVALSLDVTSLSGGSGGGAAISGLVQTASTLPYGGSVTFAGASFPAYLQGATYNPNGRVFMGDTTNNKGATWERLRFQDDLNEEWITYFAPGTTTFVLPTPPASCAGCRDRTLTTGGSLASPEAQQVIANSSTTFKGFLDFTNGPVAANLVEVMTGFSAVSIACPSGATGGGC